MSTVETQSEPWWLKPVRARKLSEAFAGFIGTGPPSVLNFPSFPIGEFKNRGALRPLLA
jgi:hypothetical protein